MKFTRAFFVVCRMTFVGATDFRTALTDKTPFGRGLVKFKKGFKRLEG